MPQQFYDKVAKKFGSYQTKARYVKEFPQEDSEKLFKSKLIELSGKDKLALDVGCADGRFTVSVASYFKEIMAIDISRGMLKSAIKYQKQKGIQNIKFIEQDVRTLPYPNNYFDIIYNRRGPSDFKLFYKVLKTSGYYIEIRIGEKDSKTLKEVFGRGQNYGNWNQSVLTKDVSELKEVGFTIVYSQEFFYNEYYLSRHDFDIFLQGVPIIEDYDPIKDHVYLEQYIKQNKSDKGIKLGRHRVITVSKKRLV